ncbi:MAG TPA: bifunctional riboflavin kinase/FAD synthetase [Vicinamibacteria bacterium]|nr:bifunctional riboflavin kinase/FAD synthetase [Vicinamibacteria bacterium]
MEVVRLDTLGPRGWPRPAVTLGNFDGLHRGHQALVAQAVADARAQGGTAVLLTFDPHPSRVLAPERAPATIMTLAQKAEILERLGVDRMAVLPFTAALAAQTAEEFARGVLEGALQAKTVVVGAGFRFGQGRTGDVAGLRRLGRTLGFQVHALRPVFHQGSPISSSRVREALARGDVAGAAEMIGRPFFIDGPIVRGLGRGRTLGIPTANIAPVNETLPGNGVYACWVRVGGREAPLWPAVTNVGRRPTFGGAETTVEAHILDVDEDLYDRPARLAFQVRLRAEQAFPGPEALVAQIRKDIARGRDALRAAGIPDGI